MLQHYQELARQYRGRIFLTAVSAALLVLALSLVLLKVSPIYKSTVIFNMQPSEEALSFNREFQGRSQFNPATIITQTHVERLLSRPVTERALDIILAESDAEAAVEPSYFDEVKLLLWQSWTRLNYGEYRPLPQREQYIEELIESVDVEIVEGSYILKLEAGHQYPAIASRIANAYADAYIEIARQDFQDGTNELAVTLRARISAAEAELQRLFAERETLRSEFDINDIRTEQELLLSSVQTLRLNLDDEQLDLSLAQAELEELIAELGSASGNARTVRDQRSDISALETRIEFRRSQIAATQEQLAALAEKESLFSTLSGEIEDVQLNLTDLRERLLSFELSGQARADQVQVIQAAKPAIYPSFPKVLINTVAAGIAGALLYLMVLSIQDMFGGRIRTSQDLLAVVSDRMLPPASPKLARRRRFLGLLSGRTRRRRRRFIEAFGQRMSVEAGWASGIVYVTGFLDKAAIERARNFLADIVESSITQTGNDKPFQVVALGPIYSVKNWDALPVGPVVVIMGPNEQDSLDISSLLTVGANPVRRPMFMLWHG